MESETSESNLIIVTKKRRILMFVSIYWRAITTLLLPIILLPIAFLDSGSAYKCFYVFILTIGLWISDALHPAIVSMIPIALATVISGAGIDIIFEVSVRNAVIECFGIMIIIIAIEDCMIHKRLAIKLLLVVGCSHYKLSFLLFSSSMFLSMWISSTMACGLFMPVVKAVLLELEKLGLVEFYEVIGKSSQKSVRHEEMMERPTYCTIFYFLGIAYSSSIGKVEIIVMVIISLSIRVLLLLARFLNLSVVPSCGIATFAGSETNQIFRMYCEIIFPTSPKIEFPQFLLLNLPSVLVTEGLVYLWLNFFFFGMCKSINTVPLQVSVTHEEAHFIKTLLRNRYEKLGKIAYYEIVVSTLVVLTALIQVIVSCKYMDGADYFAWLRPIRMSCPTLICVVLLCSLPIDLKVIRFFQRSSVIHGEPLPQAPSKACLSWNTIKSNVDWTVLLVLASSTCLFEALKASQMTKEFESFLLHFSEWPSAALILVVMVFCKGISEFTCSSTVAYCLLPHIAKLSIASKTNPHYLMIGATLSIALPFHFTIGSPVNAMVASYVHIPHWKIMYAGIGPAIASVFVIWFTITIWARAIWTDINLVPDWSQDNIFKD